MDDQARMYEELYRQTEHRLDAQSAAENSRVQRALVAVAFSVASAGFTIRAFGTTATVPFILATGLFGLAALVGIFAALPREFHGAGYRSATLPEASDKAGSDASLMASLAARNDEHIARNERGSEGAANFHRAAILCFVMGTVFGLLGPANFEPAAGG